MKTDQELFNEFREKNRTPRLFTEEQILVLMGKARKEVVNDTKNRIPGMDDLRKEFNGISEKIKKDAKLRESYCRLTQEKLLWAWFTHGAAAVLKRFKDADTSGK